MVGREPYASLARDVEHAKSVWACAATMRITKAGRDGDWKADLALLERRLPGFFSQRSRHELTGKNGGPIHHKHEAVAAMSDAQLEAYLAKKDGDEE